MSYFFKYSTEPKRVISGTIMDARFTIPALAGLGGFEVKEFVDNQVALVTNDVLLYKIETGDGNMGGFFSVSVSNMGLIGMKLQQFLRPAYQPLVSEIENEINNFIQTGLWKPDFLV